MVGGVDGRLGRLGMGIGREGAQRLRIIGGLDIGDFT